jgi:aarF domain-containing kinase
MPTCELVILLRKNQADVRFASAILLRPFQVNKNKRAKAEEKPKTEYEQQVELKQRLKSMLENEQLIPRVS